MTIITVFWREIVENRLFLNNTAMFNKTEKDGTYGVKNNYVTPLISQQENFQNSVL